MREKYTEPEAAAAEPALLASTMRELLERMLPRVDGALLLSALLAENAGSSADVYSSLGPDESPQAHELARVRRVYRAGEAAQAVEMAMRNTLTALQTEAQLLELEPLADDHRRASSRIVDLTRRLATVMRRLDSGGLASTSG